MHTRTHGCLHHRTGQNHYASSHATLGGGIKTSRIHRTKICRQVWFTVEACMNLQQRFLVGFLHRIYWHHHYKLVLVLDPNWCFRSVQYRHKHSCITHTTHTHTQAQRTHQSLHNAPITTKNAHKFICCLTGPFFPELRYSRIGRPTKVNSWVLLRQNFYRLDATSVASQ